MPDNCFVQLYYSGSDDVVCVVLRLASRKPEQTFGALVRNFIQCTLNASEKNPHTVLSNVRELQRYR